MADIKVKVKQKPTKKPPKAKVKKTVTTIVVNETFDCGEF
jgi:hypothetical protein